MVDKYVRNLQKVRESSADRKKRSAHYVLGGMFEEELSVIPQEMHARIATLIHRDVEMRVKEYMEEFRKEVFDNLNE